MLSVEQRWLVWAVGQSRLWAVGSRARLGALLLGKLHTAIRLLSTTVRA